MMKLNIMRTRLDGLVIFRGILQANIVPAFRAMLAAAGSEDFVSAAADFENQLFETRRQLDPRAAGCRFAG